MRILFSFAGGSGHFLPLVGLAKTVQAAGHSVAFTGRPGMLPSVEAEGFQAFPSGADYGDSNQRFPLAPVNMEQENATLRDFFAGRLAHGRATDILEIAADWKADLIVCDEIDFGAMLAAEKLTLPYASVLVMAAGNFVRKELLSDTLNTLRADFGLSPDPDLSFLSRHLVLSPFPPSYRDPAFPLAKTAVSIRPVLPTANQQRLDWLEELEKRPTIYFTLGTVFNRESGNLFERVINGLKTLPVNLIVTVGKHIDPAEFGEQSANVRIEQYIPQALLLPHCDLMVSQAGSGAVMGALAYGLPQLLLALGADQPLNAERCVALGLALSLDVISATPESIREAALILMENPAYRLKAETFRDEIASLPEFEIALPLLETLGQTHQIP
jgi:UDP:flavonoid glycosyltransferase YjiC (YdhE family)